MFRIGLCAPVTALLLVSLPACDRGPLDPNPSAAAGRGGSSFDPPSHTSASAVSDGQIAVGWQDNSTGESGFEVHRATGVDGAFAAIARTASDVTTYADRGLRALTEYCYQVRAFRTTGARTHLSDFSLSSCTTTPAPAAPSGVIARPSSSNGAEVLWTDNSATEDAFRIEWSTEGVNWMLAGTTGVNGTWFSQDFGQLKFIEVEPQVCYRVFATTDRGDSEASNTDCTRLPAAPTRLVANILDGPAVELTWSDNSSIEDGYEVQALFCYDYYGYGYPYCYYTPIATLAPDVTTYRHEAVGPGDQSYLVFALKDGGRSSPSNEATATVPNP